MCAFWFCLLLLGTSLPGLPLVMMGGNFGSGFWDKLENERTSNGTNGRCRFWPLLYGKLAVGLACVMVVELEVELHAGLQVKLV